jgi:hypothetical protein
MLAPDAGPARRHRLPAVPLVLAIALLVVALLASAVASAPGATKRKKYTVDLDVNAAIVASNGDRNTVAGTFTGPPYGSGAVVYKTRPGPGGAVAATYTGYHKKGTLRGTTLVTPTPQPDGTTSFNGTLQVTGGTRRFRRARGKDLKVTGTLSPADNILHFEIKGTVRY